MTTHPTKSHHVITVCSTASMVCLHLVPRLFASTTPCTWNASVMAVVAHEPTHCRSVQHSQSASYCNVLYNKFRACVMAALRTLTFPFPIADQSVNSERSEIVLTSNRLSICMSAHVANQHFHKPWLVMSIDRLTLIHTDEVRVQQFR